jgi:steroid 5-alpha reductase family enzyme
MEYLMKERRILFWVTIVSLIFLSIISFRYGILLYVGASLLGVMILMHLFFIIGIVMKNHTFVDTAWGLSFVIVAHVTFWMQKEHTLLHWLVLSMVTIWGLRLFTHILTRTIGRAEDLRYQAMRKNMQKQKSEVLASYIRVYILQGFLALFITTPIIMINTQVPNALSPWYPLGIVLWLVGFIFEVVSDKQLKAFLSNKQNEGHVMTSGLWKYSRHPNYFGESLLWWGIFVIALTVKGGWTSFFGPLLLTFLLLKVSGVPPAERLMKNFPGFEAYKNSTNKFIPWFSKGKNT